MPACAADYPNLALFATTLRTALSGHRNDWGAVCCAGTEFVQAPRCTRLEIMDRVGGGDSLRLGADLWAPDGPPLEWALEYGVAHGALAMTTPGDTSMATLAEVQHVMRGGAVRIVR